MCELTMADASPAIFSEVKRCAYTVEPVTPAGLSRVLLRVGHAQYHQATAGVMSAMGPMCWNGLVWGQDCG